MTVVAAPGNVVPFAGAGIFLEGVLVSSYASYLPHFA
jgi:hypothetical protein